tara:strand:- start:55 stop:351 length:297 start_codon:yes stop_codon:yes gene_type:complete
VVAVVLVKEHQIPVIRLMDMPLVLLTLAVEVEEDTKHRQIGLTVVLEWLLLDIELEQLAELQKQLVVLSVSLAARQFIVSLVLVILIIHLVVICHVML